MDDLFPADEESVEVVMKEKENTGEDQRKQERNLKDVVSVHGSVTGLTVDLFSRGVLDAGTLPHPVCLPEHISILN